MKLLKYPSQKTLENISSERKFELDTDVITVVQDIITDVKEKGDKALFDYTAQFDKVELNDLTVSQKEIDKAYQQISDDFLSSLRKAVKKIRRFHEKQLKENWFIYDNQNMIGQLINPLKRIGAYIPGGRAAYPSSVLMTVIPAQTAGVEEIAAVSPPDSEGDLNPYTLAALNELGIKEIYKVGGAQAVAGLALGTSTIKAVDKIVGPGNIYVTAAKKMVFGRVDIDMLAGPSEVLILADSSGQPDYIAADLLSQAEHDPQAVSWLVTTSEELAENVQKELSKQLPLLSKEEIARESLEDNGKIIVVENLKQGIQIVNDFAPEHFELVVKEPFAKLGKIKNAGAVFIGEYSSEPLGDYMAGPNHVLPTGGTARFASPLNIDDFLKKSSLIYYQKDGLKEVEKDIRRIAEIEGLDAHAEAVKKRFSPGDE